MAGTFTTATNPELQRALILKQLLSTLAPRLIIQKYVQFSSAPEGEGNVVHWLQPERMAIDVTPLSETATGSANQKDIVFTRVSGTLLSYGGNTTISEKQRRTMIGTAMQGVTKLFSQNAYETIETLYITEALTSTSTYYAAVSSGTLGVGALTPKQRPVAEDFPFLEGILGAVGAQPFDNGMFSAVLHPNQVTHLKVQRGQGDDQITWFKQNQFRNDKAAGGNAGSIANVALESCGLIPSGVLTSGTCYKGVVLAQDGLGGVSLDDMNPNVFINTPSAGDIGNPYRNQSTISWFADFAPKMLDSRRVIIYASLV